MKKIFCFTLMLIFTLSATVFAEENIRTISVSGEGIVETSPDRATISVGVVSRDKDASKVQAESARTATEILNSVVALGVERKNIRTGNYTFRQVFRTNDKGKRIFDGYEVNNTVTIVVDDIKIVGKVIDAALSHGANKVDSLQFGLRDKKNFQLEAIQLATRDARAKAEIVARELGRSIIGVRSVSVNSVSISTPRHYKLAMLDYGNVEEENFETPIEGGNLTCSASVNVDFEIN